MYKLYSDSILGFWELVYKLQEENRLITVKYEDGVSVAYVREKI